MSASAAQADLPAPRGVLRHGQALKPLTWFRVGGPAELLFQPADEADLAAFLRALDPDIAVWPMGLASNLLVRDGGVPGVTIRLGARGFGRVERLDERRLKVGAGLPDKRLAEAAAREGIGGFAFYHGIPGAVGGALRMNAGAHGADTAERLLEARAVTRRGEIVTLTNAEMGYAYRHSSAPDDLIFTEAVFEGTPSDEAMIRAEMATVAAHREAAQPIRARTGGSTFKNPPNVKAWELIDAAGCRGLRLGGAQVSPMHCNFLINTGEATAGDLERLGETVRARVLAASGLRLAWEIKRIGDFAGGVKAEPFKDYIAERARP